MNNSTTCYIKRISRITDYKDNHPKLKYGQYSRGYQLG